MPKSVEYIARNGDHERVYVGRHVPGGRCARLARYGRFVTDFVATPGQQAKLARGESITVTSSSMRSAYVWDCSTESGALRGARGGRRKKRRR